MIDLRRRLAGIAAIVTMAGGLMLVGGPAQAALPYCNNISYVGGWYGLARYETYVSNGVYTASCDMNWLNVNGTAGQRKAIKQLQWDINHCYGDNLDIDGEYGPLTRQAVREVQEYLNRVYGAGLVVDGWAGPRTRAAMSHVDEGFGCDHVSVDDEYHLPHIFVQSIPYEGP